MLPNYKISKSEAKSIVNMDFLRSGSEFKNGTLVASDDLQRERALSNNERLKKFHDITQTAGDVAGSKSSMFYLL